ncbi:MAG TPA: hypothetical protein VFE61_27045 [Candidatus Sulfotelmatobacter sp.]|jgi:hypothetical protein|nr:hypothetical protein [Candidatus Sulfotelmatobacter sp.]
MLGKKPETTGVATKVMADATRETLTDEQIVTKRKLPTRKFLTAAGMILATGALAVASGAQSAPQTPDPDKAKSSTGAPTEKAKDPDKKKAADPDKKKATGAKSSDADKAKKDKPKPPEKPSDPDAKK